jgi:hypothetical protein
MKNVMTRTKKKKPASTHPCITQNTQEGVIGGIRARTCMTMAVMYLAHRIIIIKRVYVRKTQKNIPNSTRILILSSRTWRCEDSENLARSGQPIVPDRALSDVISRHFWKEKVSIRTEESRDLFFLKEFGFEVGNDSRWAVCPSSPI